jgi:pyruvate/2-oxoglutarate dehydrogenase complex dihydrolipoamide dehydrogenase (E3) component
VIRGVGRLDGPGRVVISHDAERHGVDAKNVLLAVGSETKIPPIEGIDKVRTWTNKEATSARDLPRSLLVLGGGPTGVELAQVYARFGVPTVVVQSGPRLIPTDHPRNADAALRALERDGVTVRLGVRAVRAHPAAQPADPDVIDLDDGSTAGGHAILLAVGRTFPLDDLGLASVGIDPSDRQALPRDGRLKIADGLFLIGDPAGPELHTHQAHYQGERAVRMALGDSVTPDYRALPRATYTDPELAFVGLSLEGARDAGHDAFELVADFPKTAKGYSVEASFGHVTIVVDRASHELIGAALATPDASAAMHECVLAIQARVKVEVLAETIHAFPSTSRIFNGLFSEAAKLLAAANDQPAANGR